MREEMTRLGGQKKTLEGDIARQVGERDRAKKRDKVTEPDGTAERREQVLALLNEGLKGPEIATRLGVSYRTIKRDKEALNGRVKA